MRNLKLQMQMTVDGYVGGPNGELDWMVWDWDDELKQYVTALTEPVDTIILGRKMTDGFVNHWAAVAANPDDPEHEWGEKFTDTPKLVFSRTLTESQWPNTRVANGDLVEEVNRLKNSEGGDIIVYGGAEFVSSLIAAGLIDEYYLFTHPTALGDGLTIFKALESKQDMILTHSKPFQCGVVVHVYKPQPARQVQTA